MNQFTTCGAVAYTSSRSVGVLGPSDARPLGEPLDAEGHRSRPQDATAYVASKQERAQALARRKRLECGAEWCVSENGACGPTFAYEGLGAGFSAIFVSGPVGAAQSNGPGPQLGAYAATLPFKQPTCSRRAALLTRERRALAVWMPEERLRRRRGACPRPMVSLHLAVQVERGILVRSSHARREENMWGFAQAALDLLAECVAEAEAEAEADTAARTSPSTTATAASASSSAATAPLPPSLPPPLLSVSEDRYGGVEVSVREGGEHEVSDFVAEL